MKIRLSLVLFILTTSATLLNAQLAPPVILPSTCESELALSAAPEHLRSEAGLYLLSDDGFVLNQESSNGFTCIVNRDHPRVLKPTCFDAEGTETILPKILFFGQQLMAGKSMDEIHNAVAHKFYRGEYFSPRRPGIAYMKSNYNRPYNSMTDSLGWFPPHLMFYAPNLTNEDIGATVMDVIHEDRNQPFIGYGGPQGYMIVRLQDESTPQAGDLATCPAWVRD